MVTSLVAVVAPQIIKKFPQCFWKRRKFATKSYTTLWKGLGT